MDGSRPGPNRGSLEEYFAHERCLNTLSERSRACDVFAGGGIGDADTLLAREWTQEELEKIGFTREGGWSRIQVASLLKALSGLSVSMTADEAVEEGSDIAFDVHIRGGAPAYRVSLIQSGNEDLVLCHEVTPQKSVQLVLPHARPQSTGVYSVAVMDGTNAMQTSNSQFVYVRRSHEGGKDGGDGEDGEGSLCSWIDFFGSIHPRPQFTFQRNGVFELHEIGAFVLVPAIFPKEGEEKENTWVYIRAASRVHIIPCTKLEDVRAILGREISRARGEVVDERDPSPMIQKDQSVFDGISDSNAERNIATSSYLVPAVAVGMCLPMYYFGTVMPFLPGAVMILTAWAFRDTKERLYLGLPTNASKEMVEVRMQTLRRFLPEGNAHLKFLLEALP